MSANVNHSFSKYGYHFVHAFLFDITSATEDLLLNTHRKSSEMESRFIKRLQDEEEDDDEKEGKNESKKSCFSFFQTNSNSIQFR